MTEPRKRPQLPRFIFGLGIRHVGSQTAIDLSEAFGSLDALAHATLDDLLAVEGIGDIVAESVLAWFADSDNRQLLEKFKKFDVAPMYASRATGPLHGKGFVITGTLNRMDRDAAADRIRELGGTFQSSVGRTTAYLVVGENPGDSKVAKARTLGTKTINEEELLAILGK